MPADPTPPETAPDSASSRPARRAAVPATGARDLRALGTDSEGKTLTIPRSISFSGRIASCESLLVVGVVETELDGCRALAVVPGDVFRGGADVETADIGGTVEGTLTVRRILTVRASGRVRGQSISYGELVIERGGTVVGRVRSLPKETEQAVPAGG